ncbi:MAG: hypothetical protein ABI051_09475 [Vicinamibacterales bacterium]
MKTSISVALVILAVTLPQWAGAQSRAVPLGIGSPAQIKPRISADFGMRLPEPPRALPVFVPSNSPAAGPSAVSASSPNLAIDCQMVRRADGSIDPKLAVTPSAAVRYASRVVKVPGCGEQ